MVEHVFVVGVVEHRLGGGSGNGGPRGVFSTLELALAAARDAEADGNRPYVEEWTVDGAYQAQHELPEEA